MVRRNAPSPEAIASVRYMIDKVITTMCDLAGPQEIVCKDLNLSALCHDFCLRLVNDTHYMHLKMSSPTETLLIH